MPSFKPSRNYLFKLTEELIDKHAISGPFLEIGCGDGALSVALARRGWSGIALDLSEESVVATRVNLAQENLGGSVEVCRADFLKSSFKQIFQVVILYDVLEHVEQDGVFMGRIREVLADGGFLLFSVPIKMKEWRWDDDGYGHLRRYEEFELEKMLNSAERGFETLVRWDITFPVLWFMRRLYLSAKSPSKSTESASIEEKTTQSAFTNAGGKSTLIRIAESMPIWPLVYWAQNCFRDKCYGCNILILARAVSTSP